MKQSREASTVLSKFQQYDNIAWQWRGDQSDVSKLKTLCQVPVIGDIKFLSRPQSKAKEWWISSHIHCRDIGIGNANPKVIAGL